MERSGSSPASHTVEEIGRYVTSDSIAYLSHDGMMSAVSGSTSGSGYCSACFTGNYPVALGTENLVQLRANRAAR
jgi:amidophosphoribosyltransferase